MQICQPVVKELMDKMKDEESGSLQKILNSQLCSMLYDWYLFIQYTFQYHGNGQMGVNQYVLYRCLQPVIILIQTHSFICHNMLSVSNNSHLMLSQFWYFWQHQQPLILWTWVELYSEVSSYTVWPLHVADGWNNMFECQNTVEFHHNTIQYNILLLEALQKLKQDINQSLYLKKTSHTTPYGWAMGYLLYLCENWLLFDGIELYIGCRNIVMYGMTLTSTPYNFYNDFCNSLSEITSWHLIKQITCIHYKLLVFITPQHVFHKHFYKPFLTQQCSNIDNLFHCTCVLPNIWIFTMHSLV